MNEFYRQMWSDLYRYFETCITSAGTDRFGADGTALVKKYADDPFVSEVVCATIGYVRMIKQKGAS